MLLDVASDPVDRQVARKGRAVAVLSAVFGAVGLIFLGIFAGFGRPDVGLAVAGVVVGLPLAWTWLDHALLRRRVGAYLRERDGPGESG